jgi:cyclopropane fatty-acyl-phospholipid synthase-like methyltransferase
MGVWDKYWDSTEKSSIFSFGLKIHHRMVSDVYKSFLDPLKLKSPDIIELGSGCGELSAGMVKRYGGTATLVDNSAEALRSANAVFKSFGVKASLVKKDLFKFNPKKKYDVVHSEGLIEHFLGDEQKKIVDAHKKCAKKGGYVLISVPRPAWYYRLAKKSMEKIGKWPFGFENAMTKNTLRSAMERSGLKVIRLEERFRYSFALARV